VDDLIHGRNTLFTGDMSLPYRALAPNIRLRARVPTS